MEGRALAGLGDADVALGEGAEDEVLEHGRRLLRGAGLQHEAAEAGNASGPARREQGGEIGPALEEAPDRYGIGATPELRQVGPGFIGDRAGVGDGKSVVAPEQPEVSLRTL